MSLSSALSGACRWAPLLVTVSALGCGPSEEVGRGTSSVAVAPAPTLVSLLQARNLRFFEQDGIYKVVLANDSQSVVINCGEVTMYDDRQGLPVRIIWLWTHILSLPDDAPPPPALALKVAQVNDGLRPGNVSISPDNNDVYYNSSLWLAEATPQMVYDELAYAFFRHGELQRLLAPYLDEE